MRRDSGVFVEMKCLFSIMPKDGKGDEVVGEFSTENQAIDVGFAGVGC
jgi:hypothetical protein